MIVKTIKSVPVFLASISALIMLFGCVNAQTALSLDPSILGETRLSNTGREAVTRTVSEDVGSMNSEQIQEQSVRTVAILFGASIEEQSEHRHITFVVMSNGCTQSSDFDLSYEKLQGQAGGVIAVTVMRLGTDRCRKMPAVVSIMLPLAQGIVGQQPVQIVNEIAEVPEIRRR